MEDPRRLFAEVCITDCSISPELYNNVLVDLLEYVEGRYIDGNIENKTEYRTQEDAFGDSGTRAQKFDWSNKELDRSGCRQATASERPIQ